MKNDSSNNTSFHLLKTYYYLSLYEMHFIVYLSSSSPSVTLLDRGNYLHFIDDKTKAQSG